MQSLNPLPQAVGFVLLRLKIIQALKRCGSLKERTLNEHKRTLSIAMP